MEEGYRVQLDVFTGPLDLLLYLIRRDEVDLLDIPVARLTEQYLEHVHLLEQLDPNAAGEFLVLAAALLELKSRMLLPTPPPELADAADDPRAPLVRQLLEYKRFKDAAGALGTAADDRARRYVRRPADLPPELRGLQLEEVQVWDLLAAFGKVMEAVGRGPRLHEVRYDDVPIELHVSEVLAILERESPITFADLFENQPDRMQIVGRFLALLELIRARRIRAEQETTFGRIYIFLLVELAEADEPGAASAGEPPAATTSGTPPAAPKRATTTDAPLSDSSLSPELRDEPAL